MTTSTSPDYVEMLIEALHHEEPMTRVRAAWLLGKIGDHRAVLPLLKAAEEERQDPEFLSAVVESLGRLGDPVAVPVIIRLARTSFLKVRLTAVDALSGWHTPETEAALRAALQDPNAIVREEARRLIASIDPTEQQGEDLPC